MKQFALLLMCVLGVQCVETQAIDLMVKKSQRRSEKLYTITKTLSAASAILGGVTVFNTDDIAVRSWQLLSLASIAAHGALVYRAMDYRNLNRLSVGIGCALAPLMFFTEYLAWKRKIQYSLCDRIFSGICVVGLAKALYDVYDYQVRTLDDEFKDISF